MRSQCEYGSLLRAGGVCKANFTQDDQPAPVDAPCTVGMARSTPRRSVSYERSAEYQGTSPSDTPIASMGLTIVDLATQTVNLAISTALDGLAAFVDSNATDALTAVSLPPVVAARTAPAAAATLATPAELRGPQVQLTMKHTPSKMSSSSEARAMSSLSEASAMSSASGLVGSSSTRGCSFPADVTAQQAYSYRSLQGGDSIKSAVAPPELVETSTPQQESTIGLISGAGLHAGEFNTVPMATPPLPASLCSDVAAGEEVAASAVMCALENVKANRPSASSVPLSIPSCDASAPLVLRQLYKRSHAIATPNSTTFRTACGASMSRPASGNGCGGSVDIGGNRSGIDHDAGAMRAQMVRPRNCTPCRFTFNSWLISHGSREQAYAREIHNCELALQHPGDATPRLLLLQRSIGDFARGRYTAAILRALIVR